MNTATLPLKLRSIEELREQELAAACVIQNVMLLAHPLRVRGVFPSRELVARRIPDRS